MKSNNKNLQIKHEDIEQFIITAVKQLDIDGDVISTNSTDYDSPTNFNCSVKDRSIIFRVYYKKDGTITTGGQGGDQSLFNEILSIVKEINRKKSATNNVNNGSDVTFIKYKRTNSFLKFNKRMLRVLEHVESTIDEDEKEIFTDYAYKYANNFICSFIAFKNALFETEKVSTLFKIDTDDLKLIKDVSETIKSSTTIKLIEKLYVTNLKFVSFKENTKVDLKFNKDEIVNYYSQYIKSVCTLIDNIVISDQLEESL